MQFAWQAKHCYKKSSSISTNAIPQTIVLCLESGILYESSPKLCKWAFSPLAFPTALLLPAAHDKQLAAGFTQQMAGTGAYVHLLVSGTSQGWMVERNFSQCLDEKNKSGPS